MILFSLVYLSYVSEVKMQFRKSCLDESISLQKKMIQSEKLLFALNPLSTYLQTNLTYKEVLLKTAGINPYLAIELEAEIIIIKEQQALLDKKQKAIIATAKAYILSSQGSTLKKLTQNAYISQDKWAPYLKKIFRIGLNSQSQFAVKAESSGIAPNYGLEQDYKRLQRVAYNWHLQLLTKNENQNILKSNNDFAMSCGTMANKSGNTWSIEIIKDKY
ncbi:MAG: hypothetical protein WA160_11455 [Pseudobdellovibrio sp.]